MATIRTPDQRLRVFVSSTLGELAAERSVVREAIEGLRLTPVMFELGARPHPPREVYRAYLEQSDVFVGLYWQRYGWVAPDMAISGLEDEYELSTALPRLLYVKGPAPEREPGLVRLVERIEAEGAGCYRPFADPEELAELVRDDLAVLLTERFLTAGSPSQMPGGEAEAGTHDAGAGRSVAGRVPVERSVGTRTVVFTDVVGSTGSRQRLGEEAADRLQQVHDELLAGAVEECGGQVVKGLGDGVLAAFDSAADAVAAGVAVQRAVAAHGRRERALAFEVRVGISAGDVMVDGRDVHGSAVIEAARLCEVARGGQVLVSELVRALARGRGGLVFEPVGELELAGLAEPVAACQVEFEPFVVADDTAVAFPRLLTPPTGLDYVGRGELLAALRQAWTAADRGESGAVLVVGEPGAGKTRTAAEVAREAYAQGALVLYGRCDEDLGVPYQPFAEALDWQTAHDPELALGRFPGELLRLLPDLDQRVDDLPAPVASDPRVEEHRLFEAVASWVGDVSAERGLVLVVDDLHWATKPTVQMLVHLLRSLAGQPAARVLVVIAYRDTDVDRMHPWSEALGELRRLPHVSRHPVAELDLDEVLAFVEQAAGHPLDEPIRVLASRIHAETEGNPFFVGEVVRHFVETGVVRLENGRWVVDDQATIDVPEGVRDVVGRRLSRLSAQANEMLQVAAVIGREADVEVLARLVEGGFDVVLDGLDEALRARLMEETGPDRLRFTHELVRATLAEELSAMRRRRLHARILAVLEQLRPGEAAALARHAAEAGLVGGSLQAAVGYAVAAGDQALARRAIADARGWFEQALELAEEDPDTDPGLLAAARCGLGQAQRNQGDPTARETLLQAGRQALEAGRIELAAHAATSHGAVGMPSEIAGTLDTALVALLEDVLAHLDEPGPERAAVLAKLSLELTSDPQQRDRRLQLADGARAIARALDDPALEARVLLTTFFAMYGLERPPARAESTRARELADRAGDPELRCEARLQEAWTLLTHGEPAAANRCTIEAMQLAASEATPLIHWTASAFAVGYTAFDGDLAAARAQNAAALERGQQLGELGAATFWGGTEAGLAWLDGSYPALADAFAEHADTYPDVAVWRLGHAIALTGSGRHREARDVLTRYGLTDLDHIPDDFLVPVAFGTLAILAFELGDAALGSAVLQRIEPHRDRWAINAGFPVYPMEYAVAAAAAATEDWDRATDSARRARRLLAERGLRSHEPLACQLLAQVLLARGEPEHLAEAHTVADQGLAAAKSMGMDARANELNGLRSCATALAADHHLVVATDRDVPRTVQ